MDSVAIDPIAEDALRPAARTIAGQQYSARTAVAFVLLLLCLGQMTSALIPPLQSPDEPEHLKRAYLLSKGEVFLGGARDVTGGEIDTGLLDYIGTFQEFPFNYEKKMTHSVLRTSAAIQWSGKREFSDLFNTAFYFPLPYVPQAVAFAIGERTGLTVQNSYYLARLLSLVVTLCLLCAALLLYPTPLLVCAVFVTPMTLFQLGSASLDAVTFGLTGLAGALFMRGACTKLSFTPLMHATLIICLFTLATSRIALIALTPLPLMLYVLRGSRTYLVWSALLIVLSTSWILYALATVKGLPTRDLSTTQIMEYYLLQPLSLLQVFFATITNGVIVEGYWNMFVGILGWLDTPLGSEVYIAFAILFGLLAALSIQRRWRVSRGSLALIAAAVCSALLMFFIELVTFNPHPAKVIDYLHGRYFIPIVILLAYPVLGHRLSPWEERVGVSVLFVMIIVSIVGMIPRLLARYWMA